MTVLVFGKTGQVARELALFPDVKCLSRSDADLSDPRQCAKAIADQKPAAVINAAAYTAVDQAEEEEALAAVINGDAPTEMAKACAALDIPLVHISTDYVFDGGGTTAWMPSDATGPLGAYGRSKLAGEIGVQTHAGAHAILRTSWVHSAHGNNFVKTMLRLGASRDALTVVADQIGGPTSARDIAVACHAIARDLITEPGKSGTYHFSGAPDCSWADFARSIFQMADLNCAVTDIPSSDYPTPAVRPQNSRLDCRTTADTFGIERPDWRVGLRQILDELENVT